MDNFAFSPTDGLKNTTSFPTTPTSNAAARKQFQDVLDQIKTYLNDTLVAGLGATTDSASGADQIGATAISGLTGATVQALLEALKSALTTHETETVSKVVLVTEPFDQVTTTTVNLGFQPKNIRIEGAILVTKYACSGAKDAGDAMCRYYEVSTDTWAITGNAILFRYDGSNLISGSITITSTGITIAWTKTGTLPGVTGVNRRLIISAITH